MESKINRSLTPAEAARLLRQLADQLEKGSLEVGDEGTVPEGRLKLKVSGKSKDGSASLSLKLQWKYEEAGDAETPADAIPSYKSIKKRISSTFKKIRAQLREERVPDVELALLFDEDAELMAHHPQKGGAAEIEAFRRVSADFTAAVQAGDLETVRREVAALAAAEKSCHKKYK